MAKLMDGGGTTIYEGPARITSTLKVPPFSASKEFLDLAAELGRSTSRDMGKGTVIVVRDDDRYPFVAKMKKLGWRYTELPINGFILIKGKLKLNVVPDRVGNHGKPFDNLLVESPLTLHQDGKAIDWPGQ
jgi:hypothetical protein